MREIIQEFLLDCETGGLSQATLTLYKRTLGDFAGSLQNVRANEIQPKDIRGWMKALRERPGRSKGSQTLSPTSVRTYCAVVRAFLSWATREGLLQENPMRSIRQPRTPKKIIPSLTRQQVITLLDAWQSPRASDRRNRLVLLLLLDTGIRVGELVHLKVSDLNLSDGKIKVWGKGAKERFVPVGEITRNALQNYLEKTRPYLAKDNTDGRIFLSQRGKPLTSAEVGRILRRAKRKAGLPNELRASPHILRHTFCLELTRNGVSPFVLKRLVGHENISTTQLYVNALFQDLQEAHRRGSPVEAMLQGRTL